MRTERPINVRIAQPKDEPEILRLMNAAFVEQPIFPLAPHKMLEKIKTCTEGRGGVIGVIDGAAGLEGYIIAVLAQYWYTEDWHLEELSNFVHPDHRRSTHAKNLIEFAKWFAESTNIPLIMGILSTQRLEPKIRLYKRQVQLCGAVFVHNTGHDENLLSEMG